MIPKIIHYCWFGGNPLTEKAQKCINSWYTFLPDYEIKEWNEANFDVHCCKYVEEAYAAKKWAFVADYFRVWVLYKYGGIYFDSDVEVIKSFDEFLGYELFTGYETDKTLEPAVVGAQSGHPIFEKLLKFFNNRLFYVKNKADLTPLPKRFTQPFVADYGLELNHEKSSMLDNDKIAIFPMEWFSPMDYETGESVIGDNTHAIHRYAASWVGKKSFRAKLYCLLKKILGQKNADKIRNKFGNNKKHG